MVRGEQFRQYKLWLWLAVAGIILLAVLSFYRHYRPEQIDDAWITYRYARNMAQGNGYVYNPGERVQGTSTPLFTLMLAGLALMGADIPAASSVIALLSVGLTCLVVFFWLRRLQSSAAGGVGVAILLTSTEYMEVAASGMETAAYILLILLSFYLFSAEHHRTAFLVGGLCMLMRLDGALVLVVLAAAYGWKYRSWPTRELIIPVALNALWLGFAQIYFGLAPPHSMLAKQYQTGQKLFSFWVLDQIMVNSYFYWFLAVLGAAFAVLKSKDTGLYPLIIWLGGYIFAYSVSQLGQFQWYYTPPLVALSIFAAYGIFKIIAVLPVSDGKRVIVTGMICLIGFLPVFRATWAGSQATAFKASGIERARYDGASFAAAYIPRDATIAAGGVGMIGWFTPNYVFDYAGLVSPQVLSDKLPPASDYALEYMVIKYQPQYVFDAVPAKIGWPQVLRQDYRVVRTFPHRYQKFTEFVLWERNPSASAK